MEIFSADLLTGRAFVPFGDVSWLRGGVGYAYMRRSYDDRPELSSSICAVEGALPKSAIVHDSTAHARP